MAEQSATDTDTSTFGLHDNKLHAVIVVDQGNASIQVTVGDTILKKNATAEYAVCMFEKKKGKMGISNRKIIPVSKIIESFLKENDKGVGGLFDALRCNDINRATKIVHPKWNSDFVSHPGIGTNDNMILSQIGGWTVCR